MTTAGCASPTGWACFVNSPWHLGVFVLKSLRILNRLWHCGSVFERVTRLVAADRDLGVASAMMAPKCIDVFPWVAENPVPRVRVAVGELGIARCGALRLT
jgi:hypothetical protein